MDGWMDRGMDLQRLVRSELFGLFLRVLDPWNLFSFEIGSKSSNENAH